MSPRRPRKEPPPGQNESNEAPDKFPLPQVAEPPRVVAPPPPSKPVLYSVGVRNRCPWATIQSAGASWGREPTILPASDARLPELKRCEFLTVTEI